MALPTRQVIPTERKDTEIHYPHRSPLVITPEEIDVLIERARKSLDEAYKIVKDEGLFVAR